MPHRQMFTEAMSRHVQTGKPSALVSTVHNKCPQSEGVTEVYSRCLQHRCGNSEDCIAHY